MALSLASLGLAGCATAPKERGPEVAAVAEPPAKETPKKDQEPAPEPKKPKSVAHVLLFYVPNRLVDVLDIARLRVRVGPGIAVGARATTAAEVYLGTYASVFAGLPGPRQRPTPKLPFGLESYNGVAVSVLKGTADGGIGPNYSPTEFGFGFQAGIIGLDFALDPWEVLDLATGFLTLDLRDDSF